MVEDVTPAGTHEPHLSILVVDDDADGAEVLGEFLALELGYQVQTAADGPTALKRLEEFSPTFILLDIGLPGMDGYQLAGEIRAAGIQARLVAITGYSQAHDRQRSLEAGFAAHLTKPIDLRALIAILQAPPAP